MVSGKVPIYKDSSPSPNPRQKRATYFDSFELDESCWYSGFDGAFYAELMPAHAGYWFAAILGRNYLIAAEKPFPQADLDRFFCDRPFKLHDAIWEATPTERHRQNPYLMDGAIAHVVPRSQQGKFPLPQSPKVVEFGSPASPRRPLRQSFVCIILTRDRAAAHITNTPDPNRLLVKLQQASPQPLELLAAFPDTNGLSRSLRDRLGHCRHHGHWYAFTGELQAVLDLLLQSQGEID